MARKSRRQRAARATPRATAADPTRSNRDRAIAHFLALLSLLLFGGPTLHAFTAAMTFGAVLVGSYTSIFIASPILIYLGVGQGRATAEDTDPSAIEPQGARAATAKR